MMERPAYDQGKKCMRHRQAFAVGFAQQALHTIRPFLSVPERDLTVLDAGCGYGFTTIELARRCRRVVGIEPSAGLIDEARRLGEESGLDNVEFRRLPISELVECDAFDLVVLDNVLEHVADQRLALERLSSALKPGGALFVIVPNKLWPIEVHYDLPFLSYLPLSLANRYLRLTRRGTDYADACHAPTYFGIRRLFAERPELVHRFVLPAELSLATLGTSIHYRLGAAALRQCPWLWVISKIFVLVAVKR